MVPIATNAGVFHANPTQVVFTSIYNIIMSHATDCVRIWDRLVYRISYEAGQIVLLWSVSCICWISQQKVLHYSVAVSVGSVLILCILTFSVCDRRYNYISDRVGDIVSVHAANQFASSADELCCICIVVIKTTGIFHSACEVAKSHYSRKNTGVYIYMCISTIAYSHAPLLI